MNVKSIARVLAVLTLSVLPLAGQTAGSMTPAEQRIAKEVRHELLMLPYFGVFDYIAFNVQGHNVTLMGFVARPSLKSDAGDVVRGIEGVEEEWTTKSRCFLLPRWMMAFAFVSSERFMVTRR